HIQESIWNGQSWVVTVKHLFDSVDLRGDHSANIRLVMAKSALVTSHLLAKRPYFLIETRSPPRLTRSYPRHFAFYVAPPARSILNFSFGLSFAWLWASRLSLNSVKERGSHGALRSHLSRPPAHECFRSVDT